MNGPKFLNKAAETFHKIAYHKEPILLLVTCSISDNRLMTFEAYEALKTYMDEADRQSCITLHIAPHSAAVLGFQKVLEVEDIYAEYGSKPAN